MKSSRRRPQALDLKVQDSAYGKHLPLVHGAMWVADEVIWASDNEAEENQAEVGGKGFGGSGSEVSTVGYFATSRSHCDRGRSRRCAGSGQTAS